MAKKIILYNRQKKRSLDLRFLRRFAREALAQCLPHPLTADAPLLRLEEIEVSLTTDDEIAEVHAQFMNLPGATDVITFEHGEIVISVETAAANAKTFRKSLEEELGLYIIHGLLHLQGFDDLREEDARAMRQTQEKILRIILSSPKFQNP